LSKSTAAIHTDVFPVFITKVISFSSIDVRVLYLLHRHHHSPCTRRVHIYRRQALAMTLHPAAQSADPKSKAQKRALQVRKSSAASKDMPGLTAREWIPCSKPDLYFTLCPLNINLNDLNCGIQRIPERLRIPSCTPTTYLLFSPSCERQKTKSPAAVMAQTSEMRPNGWIKQMEKNAQLCKAVIRLTSRVEIMSLQDSTGVRRFSYSEYIERDRRLVFNLPCDGSRYVGSSCRAPMSNH